MDAQQNAQQAGVQDHARSSRRLLGARQIGGVGERDIEPGLWAVADLLHA